MIKLNRTLVIIINILILLNIAFIWGNSLVPAHGSAAISDGLMKDILDFFNLDAADLPFSSQTMHKLLRKCAHMSEFCLLAFLITLRLGKNPLKTAAAMSLLLTACIAVSDELLQTLSDRSCQITDMLIDTGGGIFGILLAACLMIIIKKRKLKSNNRVKV